MLKNKDFSIIFTLNGLVVCGNAIDLSLFYLDNQTPTNYFSDNNNVVVVDSRVEKLFEDSFSLKKNEVFQIIDYNIRIGEKAKRRIVKRSIADVIPHLNLFISDNKKDVKSVIAYDLEKFCHCFFKPQNGHDLYGEFPNKILVDFEYEFFIEKSEGVYLYKGVENIRSVITKFQIFLEKKEKLKVSKYKAGEILKNLNGLHTNYIYDNFTEIKNTAQFFVELFKNVKIIPDQKYTEITKNDIIVVRSFFSEQTTNDIIDMIFDFKHKNKKRKREQEVFIYGETFSFPRTTIEEFLKEINQTSIRLAFDESNDYVYKFLWFLKKVGQLKTINIELVAFLSIKFNKLISTEAKKIVKYFVNLKKAPEVLVLQKKNIFEIMKGKKLVHFFSFMVQRRLLYFLKYNTFFVIGNNFLTLRKRFSDQIKKKLKEVENNLKMNKKSMNYFKENTKIYFDSSSSSSSQIPTNKKRRKT